MKLSPNELQFLRHWIFDEAHYENGVGAAKKLQLENGAVAAELAKLIAAALPNPEEQRAAAIALPPTVSPTWPWSSTEIFQRRVAEAEAWLADKQRNSADSKIQKSQFR